MVTRYRPNPRFDEAFYNSDEAHDFVLAKAEEAVKYARDIAPVRTGAYRASLRADVAKDRDGWKGQAIADVPYAVYVEFGTEDTPTFATLRRAAESVERTGNG